MLKSVTPNDEKITLSAIAKIINRDKVNWSKSPDLVEVLENADARTLTFLFLRGMEKLEVQWIPLILSLNTINKPNITLLEEADNNTLTSVFKKGMQAFDLELITLILSLNTKEKPNNDFVCNELKALYDRLYALKTKAITEKKSFNKNAFWKKVAPCFDFFLYKLELTDQEKINTRHQIFNIAVLSERWELVRSFISETDTFMLSANDVNYALKHIGNTSSWDDEFFSTLHHIFLHNNERIKTESINLILTWIMNTKEWASELTDLLFILPLEPKQPYIDQALNKVVEQKQWTHLNALALNSQNPASSEALANALKNLMDSSEPSQLALVNQFFVDVHNKLPQFAINELLLHACNALNQSFTHLHINVIKVLTELKEENKPTLAILAESFRKLLETFKNKKNHSDEQALIWELLTDLYEGKQLTLDKDTIVSLFNTAGAEKNSDFVNRLCNKSGLLRPFVSDLLNFSTIKLNSDVFSDALRTASEKGEWSFVDELIKTMSNDQLNDEALSQLLINAYKQEQWGIAHYLIKLEGNLKPTQNAIHDILTEALKVISEENYIFNEPIAELIISLCSMNEDNKPSADRMSDVLQHGSKMFDKVVKLIPIIGSLEAKQEKNTALVQDLIEKCENTPLPIDALTNEALKSDNHLSEPEFSVSDNSITVDDEPFNDPFADNNNELSSSDEKSFENEQPLQNVESLVDVNVIPSPIFSSEHTLEETPTSPTENDPVINSTMSINSSTSFPDIDQMLKAQATQAIPSNQLFQDFVTATIIKISGTEDENGGKDTTRFTHNKNHKKVILLEKLKAWLDNPIQPGQEQYVLAIINSICKIRRHPCHLFSKPHSLRELDVFIGNNALVKSWVNNTIDISKEQIAGLEDIEAISSLVKNLSNPSNFQVKKLSA